MLALKPQETSLLVRIAGLLSILLFPLFFSVPALADDIEVFKTHSTGKPNVLFILDRSGSMNFNVAGDPETDVTLQRGTILREAFQAVLDDNKDTINAGLSTYQGFAHGIRWPVGDLNQNAGEIDSSIDITEGYTSLTIMDKIYESITDQYYTNIVGALYESAMYFRGDQPSMGGFLAPVDYPYKTSRSDYYAPAIWDPVASTFVSIDPVKYGIFGPARSTQTPPDAFIPGTGIRVDGPRECLDFTVGGTDTTPYHRGNECARYDRVDNCQY